MSETTNCRTKIAVFPGFRISKSLSRNLRTPNSTCMMLCVIVMLCPNFSVLCLTVFYSSSNQTTSMLIYQTVLVKTKVRYYARAKSQLQRCISIRESRFGIGFPQIFGSTRTKNSNLAPKTFCFLRRNTSIKDFLFTQFAYSFSWHIKHISALAAWKSLCWRRVFIFF